MSNLRKKDLKKLKKDVEETVKSLNLDEKKKKLKLLEEESLRNDFWKNPQKAQGTMSKIAHIQNEIDTANQLIKETASLIEVFESLEDKKMKNELSEEYSVLREKLDKFSLRKFLSNKYDILKAVITINAGQGGTESNDWAQMLYRMYTMFFDSQDWDYSVAEITKGSETGITSATIKIKEPYSFGMLKKEHGAHRLVRISPYNAQGLRQTTFAGVEVLPVFEDVNTQDKTLEIPSKDVIFKAVRSSGPGGQSVNKTSSAVQLTHTPTGITAHSSEHKSQAQNKEAAMQILRAKLWRVKEEERLEKISEIKGEYKVAGWGNQIRNYILHPYKLVKDLRTGVESKDPEKVLDGNIGKFLDAQVRLE
jgi:peptide chain release factor 2